METRMALRITRRIWLVIVIIAFMTTMARTESEIPENKVIVDIRPVFLRGYDGMLQCRFNGAPLAVFWLKGADLATGTNLVTWYPPPRVVSGSGYVSGKYNLTEDFSLVIHNVTDDDVGRYICRISNFNGFILRNYTEATVKTPPPEPFPTIDQCPTGADGRGTETCILTQETGADSTELTCRTTEAPRGVVSLSWTLGGRTVPLQAPQRSTNPDGDTEDVMVAINATLSDDPYVCVAILPATTRSQATVSVTVNAAPIPIATTTDSVMTTNVATSDRDSINIKTIVIPVVIIFIIVLVVVVILIFRKSIERTCKRRGYHHPPSRKIKDKGIISYFELEKVVERFNIADLSLIVSELIDDSQRELEPECTKADLYKYLCEWKESSGGSAILLSSAMEKYDLENELQIVDDFFANADNTVSDDDLEHICWHVHSCRETVKPIVGSSFTKSTKPAYNGHISAPPRCDEILEDLQIMKRWRDATTYGNEDDQFDDTVKFRRKSEEIGLKSKNTQSMPSHQMIKLCRALEKAAKKTRDGDGQVYHQLSKTFYKIQKEYKSELTNEVLKEFALSITKRHCQRLGNTLKLPAETIAKRNEEDLEMFRTDDMLKAWVMDQKCSNYEIRRRLRQAAEQCDHQDIADNFISKEQSEVMPSITKLQACVTITNEKQSPGASASGSRDVLGNGASSKPVPQSSHGDSEETPTILAQPAVSNAESEVGFVSVISRDELNRIGLYAGSAVLLALCSEYGVTEIPDQQSSEGKELPFETKIINVLKPKLDSEHEISTDDAGKNTPRKTLRRLLKNRYPRYACLLAKGKPTKDIFNVELIDLAFRLIMSDVYPFAKALNISDQLLTPNRGNFGPHNLRQGTVKIMLTDNRSTMVKATVNTNPRFRMVKVLKQTGYSVEARGLNFGCEIGLGDVVEVENRVDKAQLVEQLGVFDDVNSKGLGNQGKDDTLHQSVLLRWRDTVRSSTFNHRLVLADALFRMEEEQLALDIISGVYRKRAIDNQVSDRLSATIPETEMPSLRKLLDQKVKDGQKCQDVITAWVAEKKLINLFSKSPNELSNELLGAGFYAFAHEIMAGAWKVDKKAGQKGGKEIVKAATKELHPESITINENGEQEDKEEKEGMEKAPNGDTGKEGARNLDKKAGQTEGTETGNAAIENVHQKGTPTDKQGEKDGKVEKEETDKDKNGDPLENNTDKKGKRKGKVGKKDLEPVAKDNESTSTKGIQEAYTKGPSQNEDKKSSGKEAKDSNVAEISKEENPSTKAKGANHGKESDKAPEEEASLNNNGTDGEQDSLDDDFEHVSKEDVVQQMSRDGAAESRENTTENVDTMEQGNTSDGSDEHRREESSETPLQVKAISRTQAFS